MSMSSTTLARMNIAVPFERCSTKSSISAFSNTGSPRMRSTTFVEPSRACGTAAPGPRPAPTHDHGRTRRSRALVALRPRRRSPRECSRSSRRGRHRERRAAASACSAVRWLWKYGPSSHSTPIHRSALWMPSIHSSRLRSVSVSSMRRTNVPPCWRSVDPVVEGGLRAAHVEVARRGGARTARAERTRSHGEATGHGCGISGRDH